MAESKLKKFTIGISSRALFDLSREHQIFIDHGPIGYAQYQIQNEQELLDAGPAFPLVSSLLRLNKYLPEEVAIEVVLLSQNTPAAGLRVRNSVKAHELEISRSIFTGGSSVVPYLRPHEVDLFLTASAEDVDLAFQAGRAAALLWGLPTKKRDHDIDCVRIAFDGDAVLFDEESEKIYKEKGAQAFFEHEEANKDVPLNPGPFERILSAFSYMQKRLPEGAGLIRTALITARNAPADERVIRTIRDHWDISIDELMLLGGKSKKDFVEAFAPHIFFDDQTTHCAPVSTVAAVGQVPSNLYSITEVPDVRCPDCSAPMLKKRAFRGRNSGKPFYGCSRFPECRGSISIS
jgi:5'-nucleotidase